MGRVVARVGKPHGIRGEVTVRLHTDDPETRFTPGARFPTEAQPGSGVPRELTLRSARRHKGSWLLAFMEIDDRTGAEGLRGTRLLTPLGASAEVLESGQPGEAWYEEELVGLPVTRPDGSPVGTVAGLEIGPGQDRLVVMLASGGTASVPFVSALVPVVDVTGRRVVIDPPEGLLELAP